MSEAFPELLLTRLHVADEVEIETRSADGRVHRVPI